MECTEEGSGEERSGRLYHASAGRKAEAPCVSLPLSLEPESSAAARTVLSSRTSSR